jgi:hypothetical protein
MTMPFLKQLLKAMGTARHGHGICELASTILRQHLGDLPMFGFFRQ